MGAGLGLGWPGGIKMVGSYCLSPVRFLEGSAAAVCPDLCVCMRHRLQDRVLFQEVLQSVLWVAHGEV